MVFDRTQSKVPQVEPGEQSELVWVARKDKRGGTALYNSIFKFELYKI